MYSYMRINTTVGSPTNSFGTIEIRQNRYYLNL